MAASAEDIRSWLNRAKAKPNCTHVVVVCDTYDWEDYPVFVMQNEDIQEQVDHYNGSSMQKVLEVYKLDLDLDTQMQEPQACQMQES